MHALIARGASGREASERVSKELRIPSSTLRKHLSRIHRRVIEFDVPFETRTAEQAAEAMRRNDARARELEASRPKKKPQERVEMMRRLGLFVPLPPRPKKKRE
jgi:predicted transcriptional regulator